MSTPSSKHWISGIRGYVIRSERHYDTRGGPITHVSWWQGLDHGWGTAYSSVGYSTAVFVTRQAAEKAYRVVYGRMPKGSKAQTVQAAETESKAVGGPDDHDLAVYPTDD